MAQQNTMNPSAAQAPASNTNAVLTMAAPTATGKGWSLSNISWSYSGTPVGSLTIAWGIYSMSFFIVTAGPGQLQFYPPLVFPADTAVTITLSAGGSGVTGTVYASATTGD